MNSLLPTSVVEKTVGGASSWVADNGVTNLLQAVADLSNANTLGKHGSTDTTNMGRGHGGSGQGTGTTSWGSGEDAGAGSINVNYSNALVTERERGEG